MKEGKLRKVLAALGIARVGEKGGRRRWGRLAILVLVLLVVAMAGLVKFSETPTFCNSCHIMRPYYEGWKTSTHNKVACVKCHYPPGLSEGFKGKFKALSQVTKYVTRTYGTKPYAEIEDASCLQKGCHDTRLLKPRVTFKEDIIFDHRPHIKELRRGKRLRCTTCHSQIVQGLHISVTEEVCFICHFKDREKHLKVSDCKLCHEVIPRWVKADGRTIHHSRFATLATQCERCHSDVVRGEGEVMPARCIDCHGEPERLKRFGDTDFMHKEHVTDHKVECYQCHNPIKHSIKAVEDPLARGCNRCHRLKHNVISQLYRGVGGRGLSGIPSPMSVARVDCTGCHFGPSLDQGSIAFTGQTVRPAAQACSSCHGPGYDEVLAMWRENLASSLHSTEAYLQKARHAVEAASSSHPNYEKALKLFKDASYNMEFVKYGKGIHNIEYSVNLLALSSRKAEETIRLLYGKP